LKYLHLTIGVGKSEIDLKGNWDHDVDIEIDGGIGVTTLYLPEDVGVRVKVKRGFGKVNSKRLRKRKNIYTNKAYDSSDVTINIKINAGIGAINLK
jgi:predicted membrane protein